MGMKKYFVKIKEKKEKKAIISKQPVSKIMPFLNKKKSLTLKVQILD